MFTTMMGSVYGLLCWVQTDDSDRFHHDLPARRGGVAHWPAR